MGWEALAALAVGIAALAWVLEPMVRPRPESTGFLEPPEPEETPKGIALGALREIEFDRATGKLSDTDYQALLAKYTAVAVAVMKTADAGAKAETLGSADDIEAVIAARVLQLRSPGTLSVPDTPANPMLGSRTVTACPHCGPRPEADAIFCSNCGTRIHSSAACSSCGTTLRPDSRFCEECGTRVAA